MRCEQAREQMPFYPRADLPRPVLRAMTEHLRRCQVCRRALADAQHTTDLLQAHVRAAPGGDAEEAKRAIQARLGIGAASLSRPQADRPHPSIDAEEGDRL